MAIKDSQGNLHSEDNGRFVNQDDLSAAELKEQLQQELPNDTVNREDSYKYGSQEDFDQLLGEEFKGVKGQAAVDKLLKEQRGHVKGAFHRDDVGDIDLLWGNDYLGLKHIIKQREKQGINADAFLQDLTNVIEKGDFYQKSDRGNFEFIYDGKMAVIAPEYRGNKITFVLTAYKTRKKAPLKNNA